MAKPIIVHTTEGDQQVYTFNINSEDLTSGSVNFRLRRPSQADGQDVVAVISQASPAIVTVTISGSLIDRGDSLGQLKATRGDASKFSVPADGPFVIDAARSP